MLSLSISTGIINSSKITSKINFDTIKAVLFDFDGVVAQTEPIHLQTFRELLKPLGVKISEERWYREFTGIGSTAIMAKLFQDFKIKKDVKIWVKKRKLLYQKYVKNGTIRATPGIRKFLLELRRKNIKIAIVSGGHSTNINRVLEKLKLMEFFDSYNIISLEDVKNRKPHPEGFLLAAKRLLVRPKECLAIEDSISGIIAANRAKMKVVCVRSPAPVDLNKCDYVIKDFRECNNIIAKKKS